MPGRVPSAAGRFRRRSTRAGAVHVRAEVVEAGSAPIRLGMRTRRDSRCGPGCSDCASWLLRSGRTPTGRLLLARPPDTSGRRSLRATATPVAAPGPVAGAGTTPEAAEPAAGCVESCHVAGRATTDAATTPGMPASFEDVAEHATRAVVRVEAGNTTGSGFFGGADTVLTNMHVVRGRCRHGSPPPTAARHRPGWLPRLPTSTWRC